MMARYATVLLALLFCGLFIGLAESNETVNLSQSNSTDSSGSSEEEEEKTTVVESAIGNGTNEIRFEETAIDAGGMVDNVEAELISDGSMHIKPAPPPFINVAPMVGDVIPLAVIPTVVETSSDTKIETSTVSFDKSKSQRDEKTLSEVMTEEPPEATGDPEMTTETPEVIEDFRATTESGIVHEVLQKTSNVGSGVVTKIVDDLQSLQNFSTRIEDTSPADNVLESSEPHVDPDVDDMKEPKDFEPGPRSLAGLVADKKSAVADKPQYKSASKNLFHYFVLFTCLVIIYLF